MLESCFWCEGKMIDIGEDTKCCINCGWMYKLRGNRKGNNEREPEGSTHEGGGKDKRLHMGIREE